jgi:hypothetical protein
VSVSLFRAAFPFLPIVLLSGAGLTSGQVTLSAGDMRGGEPHVVNDQARTNTDGRKRRGLRIFPELEGKVAS